MKLYLATISISECEYSSGLAKYFPNKAQATKYAKEWCKENEDITFYPNMVKPVDVKLNKKGILNLLSEAEFHFVHDLGGGYVG